MIILNGESRATQNLNDKYEKVRYPVVKLSKKRTPITEIIGFEIFVHVALGTGLLLFLCILVPGVDPLLHSAGSEAPFLSKFISNVSRDVRQNWVSIVAFAVIGDALIIVALGSVGARWLKRFWLKTVSVVLTILLIGVSFGFIVPFIVVWIGGS